MKKILIFLVLTLLTVFSCYELHTISALYANQEGMVEFISNPSNQKNPQADLAQLNDFKFELNTWRAIYIGYIIFYLFYISRLFIRALKPKTN